MSKQPATLLYLIAMTDRQDQRSGNHSRNVQVGRDLHVIAGLSYRDVRDIVEDVFRSSVLETLRGDAREQAQQRANEILNEFIDKLKSMHTEPPLTLRDPDMFFALTDAQKAFARSGEPELAHVLTDVLVRRSSEPQRTTLQLVLNESLLVAPKLNVHQFDLLTLSWIMRHVLVMEVPNRERLLTELSDSLEPFVSNLRVPDSSYSHLQYAGCGSLEMGAADIGFLLSKAYPELFPGIQHDPSVVKTFSDHSDVLRRIAEYWNASDARRFTLTSVGTAIANAHFASKFPGRDVPLSTWIF
jgi:hypothetical protein